MGLRPVPVTGPAAGRLLARAPRGGQNGPDLLRGAGGDVLAIGAGNASTLTLSFRDARNLSDESNRLTITGDASDAVVANFGGAAVAVGASTTSYTLGLLTVVIDNDINQAAITT